MKLSILILTHNRPKLFVRCLKSALKNIPDYVEILVNNDSNDIQEIQHPQVKYFYRTDYDLSDTYNFLLDEAKGEFCYFLEDDDFLSNKFYNIFEKYNNNDVILGNFIPDQGVKKYIEKSRSFKSEGLYNLNLENIDVKDFQLGQVIFKKSISSRFKGNILDNDVIFFSSLKSDKFYYTREIFFTQTYDARDNISYDIFRRDDRFKYSWEK